MSVVSKKGWLCTIEKMLNAIDYNEKHEVIFIYLVFQKKIQKIFEEIQIIEKNESYSGQIKIVRTNDSCNFHNIFEVTRVTVKSKFGSLIHLTIQDNKSNWIC